MRRVAVLRLSVALVLAMGLGGRPAKAQVGRQALIQGTEAYSLADLDRALALLSLGLDPSAGPRDGLWSTGVQDLAHALLQRSQVDLAETWLRWALRLEPGMVVDSVDFPPSVWLAFDRARESVNSTLRDTAVVRAGWQWSSAAAPGASGSLVVRSSGPAIAARVEGGEPLVAGIPRSAPAGSYTIVATADGYQPARARVEVLPGVATLLLFRLQQLPSGTLYVASRPWGTVFLDSVRIGYTAIAAHPLRPGTHRLQIQRDGFFPFDTTLTVGTGQQLRLGTVRLRPRSP